MSEYNIIQDGHAEYDGTSSISGGDTFQTDFSLSPSYPLGTSDVNQKKYYFKTKIKVIDAADKIYDIDVFQVNQDGSDEIKIGDYNTKTKKVVMNGNAPGNSLFNYGGWLKNKNPIYIPILFNIPFINIFNNRGAKLVKFYYFYHFIEN